MTIIQALVILAVAAGGYSIGYLHGYVTRHYREHPPQTKQQPARQTRIDVEA